MEGKVRVGPAGWAYKDWNGIVYPPGMRGTHPLRLLSGWFDLVEINVSFYRPFSAAHAVEWLRQVEGNPEFVFTVKLWQRFTHEGTAWPGAEAERVFREGIAPIVAAGRLGAVLAQFPWSFRRTPENRAHLGRIAEAFGDLPLAVEVRHLSWLDDRFLEGLRARGIAFCNIDQPVLAECIGPTGFVTGPFGYVRLHGRNREQWFREGADRDARYNYLYSKPELAEWLRLIETMRKRSANMYAVTNNHYRGKAVANAVELQEMLGKKVERLPETLVFAYPGIADCGLRNEEWELWEGMGRMGGMGRRDEGLFWE